VFDFGVESASCVGDYGGVRCAYGIISAISWVCWNVMFGCSCS